MLAGTGTKQKLRRTAILIALLWTGIIAGLAAWHDHRVRGQYTELARVHARAAHTKDLIYRQWNAHHGGVYVPVTEALNPNPYLEVPRRDVETPWGQKLTLVNPAYMTRQVHEIGASDHEIRAHITSLHPINPVNAPDDWERRALLAFEHGETEVASLAEINDRLVMRLIRPLITRKSCLKCHAKQGYAVGDVRGAISVSVPMGPLLAARNTEIRHAMFGYGALWGLGVFGLWLAWKALSRSVELLERTNLRLDEQRRVAEDAASTRGKFLANVSHEIRTPLTAILGFADLLRDEFRCRENCPQCDSCDIHTENATHVETIRRNGSHLLELVNEVLDLSKIESGELGLNPEPCRLADQIAEVASLMEVRAGSKELELVVEHEETIPDRIVVDVKRFRQILLNLVGNAVKFTESGRVTITARPDRDGEQARIAIDVRDTGPGIPKDKIDAVFEPFIQGEMSATREHGGTGLGLAISNRLAGELGGELSVRSRVGAGSCFTLKLPIADSSSSSASQPCLDNEAGEGAAPAAVSDAGKATRLAGRVLLVEDGADNRRLIALILRRAGVEVVLAENGKVACDLLLRAGKNESFDLILMDMQMPIMDGYEATRMLRQSGYRGTIVALTAHATDEESGKCLEAGCDEYASKPIDRSRLLELLGRHLKAQAGSKAPASL